MSSTDRLFQFICVGRHARCLKLGSKPDFMPARYSTAQLPAN